MPVISGPDEVADHNISLCLLQGITLILRKNIFHNNGKHLIVILSEVKG